ncbi:MAG: DUF1553 domain-containing protein [Cyclobacteriaceae bacterium]|nr:DUF1553 domain-containing protein [Cyclobacteriaceae bacterium SS2]
MHSCKFTIFILVVLIGCQSKIELPDDVAVAYEKLPDVVDYNYHIKPILSENCFQCHGPDAAKQKADLRLDIADSAYNELPQSPGKYAIVRKKPAASEVVKRILSDDPDYMMPVLESHLKLTAHEKAAIVKWIRQGAKYKKHWAYIPPQKSDLPEVEQESLVQNEIDPFILKKLEVQGLNPSEMADKEILFRRLSFAIRGLPPSIEETDAFVSDTDPNSYEKWVDKFLASSDYGERMAIYWLELARFADSDGYLDDKMRDFTPWRDWIIKAFNDNMSYKDFVTWQLAGDLIENPTKESVLATAFNRLHKRNSEAGIVYEEFRSEYVADRTNTFGKAFLASSFECARCHDHKYDPISQKNYYQLYAFFNSTDEIGSAVYGPDITPGPSMLLTTEKQDEIIKYLNVKLEEKKQTLSEIRNQGSTNEVSSTKLLEDVKQSLSASELLYFNFDRQYQKGDKIYSAGKNNKRALQTRFVSLAEGISNESLLIDGDYGRANLDNRDFLYEKTEPFSFDFWINPPKHYDEALIFANAQTIRYGFKGYNCLLDSNRVKFIISHAWPYNSLEVVSRDPLPESKWSHIAITYDGTSSAEGIRLYLDGKELTKEIRRDNLYKGLIYEENIHTLSSHELMFGNEQFQKMFKNGRIDEFRMYKKALTPLEVKYLNGEDLSDQIPELNKEFYATLSPTFQREKSAYKALADSLTNLLNDVPEIMVMGDLEEPRKTFVLNRGVYDDYGEEVTIGMPASMLDFSTEYTQNRLGLAQWLFDTENPLTARVMVNRVWQMHFGKGLVSTSEEFGSQGSLPSHPELLDWLAVWFMENDWDLKALHKKIVMSYTFQQSSEITPEFREKDPENIFLARGPRFRMPAEMIRDNALKSSGLLVSRIGGESEYPYQPEGLWDEVSNKIWRYPYKQGKGEGLYRKSIYTVWKRTTTPPGLMIFDAADRGACEVRRKTTSTPLQSLILLNDPQYVEASRVMSENAMMAFPDDSIRQLKYVYRANTGQTPGSEQLAKTTMLYEKMLNKYQEDITAAKQLVNVGEKPVLENVQVDQLAALTVVANALMNTYEAYTIQ